MMGNKIECIVQILVERFFVQYQLVTGGDDDVRLHVSATHAHRRPGNTGCRTAINRLNHQILLAQRRQLVSNDRRILFVRTDKNILLGQNLGKPVENLLKLCTTNTKEVDKLLRFLVSAAGS